MLVCYAKYNDSIVSICYASSDLLTVNANGVEDISPVRLASASSRYGDLLRLPMLVRGRGGIGRSNATIDGFDVVASSTCCNR